MKTLYKLFLVVLVSYLTGCARLDFDGTENKGKR